ncbi:hypothetical protein MSAR_41280 [Mycolicibacterium sarraceniae]|uniref:Monooxygenase n=1 Tax=Mycolicibacterium sarraceniae TaxID=1534348 RepID=A0A7I7SVE5_9MYCO|nr:hypothetical protein MSAR_41280 [Mycolicibacterium sarraceniae]
MATGALSSAITPAFEGLEVFGGEIYHTAQWPHEGMDFTGRRVAVIGTGSSGIQSIAIIAEQAHVDLDAIVFATGFHALTGSLGTIDTVGRGRELPRDDWAHGPRSYLGLGDDGFPNLFVVTGPGAPAVLANMVLHAESHVEWIAEAIGYLEAHGYAASSRCRMPSRIGSPNSISAPRPPCSRKPTRGT